MMRLNLGLDIDLRLLPSSEPNYSEGEADLLVNLCIKRLADRHYFSYKVNYIDSICAESAI